MRTFTFRLFLRISLLCCATFLSVTPLLGGLDPTFGTGGRVTLSLGSLGSQASRVFVQPDGRILVVGAAVEPVTGGTGFRDRIAIAALRPDGTLDPTFNGSGTRIIGSEDPFSSWFLWDVHMQSDGKLVILGRYGGLQAPVGARIIRLNPDGSNDSSFSANLQLDAFESLPRSMAVRSDGKILVALFHGWNKIVRLNPDGSRDQSFGSDGVTLMPLERLRSRHVHRIRTMPNDRSVILFGSGGGVIARLDSDANIDRSFGINGVATVYDNDGLPFGTTELSDLAVQTDGKVCISGRLGGTGTPLAARLSFRGKPDSSFGNNGVVTIPPAETGNLSYSVFTDVKGNIVMSGTSMNEMMVAEIGADGTVLGRAFPTFPETTGSSGRDAIRLHDGSVIVVGTIQSSKNPVRFAIAKYLSID